MKKLVSSFIELGTGRDKHLRDYIEDNPIDGKSQILKYMRNGKDDGIRCASIYDYIRGKSMIDTVHRYTDGEYFWSDNDIYHFDKYNMELNPDFIEKVLSNGKR